MKLSNYYNEILLVFVVAFSSFLASFRLNYLMPFIGDQAWFYVSARDIWLKGDIPLVGITSSHTWLHQGALWTYILAIILPLGKYNPVVPAYFTVFVTVVTGVLLYIGFGKIFSGKVGLITAVLFLTSPLVIMAARMPYHTTLIPTFTLLLLFVTLLWVKGHARYFPLIFLLLGILYNFELATVVLWVVPLVLLVYGYWKKETWFRRLLNKNTVVLSIIFGIIPMIPIFIYDSHHGFPQTIVYAGWILARVLSPVLPFLHLAPSDHSFSEVISFLINNNASLMLGGQRVWASLITLIGTICFISSLYKKRNINEIVVGLYFFISLISLILSKTPSGAYLPMLFPAFFLMLGIGFASYTRKNYQTVILGVIVTFIAIFNSFWLLSNNYSVRGVKQSGISIVDRIAASQKIVNAANGRYYSIEQIGPGSEFESSRINTQYLTWWLGNEPKTNRQKLFFIIDETAGRLIVREKNSILGVW